MQRNGVGTRWYEPEEGPAASEHLSLRDYKASEVLISFMTKLAGVQSN